VEIAREKTASSPRPSAPEEERERITQRQVAVRNGYGAGYVRLVTAASGSVLTFFANTDSKKMQY